MWEFNCNFVSAVASKADIKPHFILALAARNRLIKVFVQANFIETSKGWPL
jgi:hypothetical protein